MKIKNILKNLKVKYILFILTFSFVIISIFFNIVQQNTLMSNLKESMQKDNTLISISLNHFFSEYIQIVRLMEEDDYLINYIREVTTSEDRLNNSNYNDVIQSLNNVNASNKLIKYPWIGVNEINSYIIHNPMVNLRPINPNYDYREYSWYDNLLSSNGDIIISPFYISTVDGRMICSVVSPVMRNSEEEESVEKNIGQIGIDLDIDTIAKLVNQFKIGKNGFAILTDKEGRYIATPDVWSDKKYILHETGTLYDLGVDMISSHSGLKEYRVNYTNYYVSYSPVGLEGFSIATFIPTSEVKGKLVFTNIISIAVIAMSIIIFIISVVLGNTNNLLKEMLNNSKEQKEKLEVVNLELATSIKQLNIAQDSLVESKKSEALTTLVTGIAHEINTPIGTSYTSITYLENKINTFKEKYYINKLTKKDIESFLEDSSQATIIIKNCTSNAINLIDNFKKLASDSEDLIIKEFNLKQLFEYLVKGSDLSLEAHVNIKCDETILIKGYPLVYSQIISNLLLNTITHAYENIDDVRVDLGIELSEDFLSIKYRDYGHGMTEDVSKKVFDPFFTTNRGLDNVGLGLNIIYNLVTSKLKGTLTLQSILDEGTVFEIKVPLLLKK